MATPAHLKKVPQQDLHFLDSCPICGASADHRTRAVTLQDAPCKVDMVKCSVCKACSAEALPSADHLNKVYDPEHYSATLTNVPQLTASLCRRLIEKFDAKGRTQIRILDYGGGNGMLAKELMKQISVAFPQISDVRATVVDLFDLVEGDNVQFLHVDDFLKSGETYDIIVASAVLEHVPHLQPVLERLLDSGAENALFYARCPFEIPIASKTSLYKINWPIHVHDIGPEFWTYTERVSQGKIQILESRTSIVETNMSFKPFKTIIAHVLKLPSKFETAVLKKIFGYERFLWNYVGGWEIYLCLNPSDRINQK